MEEQEEEEEVDPLLNAHVGNYEIRRKLGEGGMGSVYLAEHPLIGKKVALKVLHPEFANSKEVVTRFFNEAKAVNDIQHPNIVDIIDYGVIPDPEGGREMVYFIMEHLDGHSLEDIIAEQAPLSPERCLHICVQVADALAASHSSHIVHRDLKPDNIILVPHRSTNDFVKLLDFGIAKLTGDQPGSNKTRTGIVMGTPLYMSPEQCEGKGNIDHRTDVYALGIVLYQMLTGTTPFTGEGYGEILVKHLTQVPARPSTVRGVIPPHVEAVCMKALEKNPDARYQSMTDFMAALADPVAFVEANGGLDGFWSANLGAAVIPSTPPPGQVIHTPPPRAITASPSGLYPPSGVHSPSGVHDYPATKSKVPLIAGGAVALAVVVGAIIMFGGGDDTKEPVAAVPPPVVEPVKPATEPVKVEPVKVEPEKPVQTLAVKVQVTIKSNVRGAEIFDDDDEGKLLGKTPKVLRQFKSDQLPRKFIIRKKGYDDEPVIFDFNEDQQRQRYTLKVELKKVRRGSKPRVVTSSKPSTTKPTATKPTATKPKTTTRPTRTKPKDTTGLLAPGSDTPRKNKPRPQGNDNTIAPSFD